MNRIAALDMLRGYALVCIMLDHMPMGVLRNVTLDLRCENPAILVGGRSIVTVEPSTKIVGTKPDAKGGTVKGL